VNYVQAQEQDGSLVHAGDVTISGAVATSEGPAPDFLIRFQTSSSERAQDLLEYWTAQLRRLFDRWDVCDLDIAWESIIVQNGKEVDVTALTTSGCDAQPTFERSPT